MEQIENIERFVKRRVASFSQPEVRMLIRAVEKFLRRHEMAATKFGRLAAQDPRFVLDLRMGRIPRAATESRIRRWMNDYEEPLYV